MSFSHDVVGPFLEFASIKPVAEPDLRIRGGGGGPGLQKGIFRSLVPQFGLKIRGARSPPSGCAAENTRRRKRAIIIIINEFKIGNRENQV